MSTIISRRSEKTSENIEDMKDSALSEPRIKSKLGNISWAALAGAIVVTIAFPIAIDQGYFRYNVYILPLLGLFACLLYIGFAITSRFFIGFVQDWMQTHRNWCISTCIIASLILIAGIATGFYFALQKSKQHVAYAKAAEVRVTMQSSGQQDTQIGTTAIRVQSENGSETVPTQESRLDRSRLSANNSTREVIRPSAHAKNQPQQVINAPNGIAIGGGVVNNPTVNNYGPPPEPPAHITVEQEAFSSPTGKLVAKVTLRVDHTLETPDFVVTCDRPCYLDRTGTGSYAMSNLVKSPNIAPNRFAPIFAAPKPMYPGYLWLFVAANDGSVPHITKIEAAKKSKPAQSPSLAPAIPAPSIVNAPYCPGGICPTGPTFGNQIVYNTPPEPNITAAQELVKEGGEYKCTVTLHTDRALTSNLMFYLMFDGPLDPDEQVMVRTSTGDPGIETAIGSERGNDYLGSVLRFSIITISSLPANAIISVVVHSKQPIKLKSFQRGP